MGLPLIMGARQDNGDSSTANGEIICKGLFQTFLIMQ